MGGRYFMGRGLTRINANFIAALRSICANRRHLRPILLLLIGLMATAVTHAQEQVTAAISADRSALTVGDPVSVTVQISHPANYSLLPPPTTWDEVELLQMNTPQPTAQGTLVQFTITLWAPGSYELPPIPFTLENDVGESVTAVTNPLSLTVESVLTDSDRELRDIRPQAAIPLTMQWSWLWLALALALGGGGTAVWRARRPATPTAAPVILTVQQESLAQLDRLDEQPPERLAAYATAVLHILRRFLQQAYSIPASRRTTSELALALNQTTIPADQQKEAVMLLQQIDAVRFSGQAANLSGAQLSGSVRRFIQNVW